MAFEHRTFADEFRAIPMSWVWIAALATILIVGGGFTPWETLTTLLSQGGVSDEGWALIGFVAGYTLPLTAGLAVIVYGGLVGAHRRLSQTAGFLIVAGILVLSGALASALGLGLLPEYSLTVPRSGPWFAWPLAWVLQGYVNSYGTPLMISSAAVAVALAIQVERWNRASTPPAP